MKLAGIPIFVFLFLVLYYSSSSSISQHKIQLSSSPLLLFSLFNTIIFAIFVGNYKPYSQEVDVFFPYYSHEVGEDTHDNIIDYIKDNENSDGEEEDDDDDEYHGSDGYDEDDDDNGSDDDEIGWEDEDEYDDNLQNRIEDFIAKINDGWRKEMLRDKLCL